MAKRIQRSPVRTRQASPSPLKLAEALRSEDVELVLVKNGDHRLSSDADIARLCATVETLCARLETPTGARS